VALFGCGPPPCPEAASDLDTAPRLTEFDLDSQLAGDPWTAIFALTFEDNDGDLGNGNAEFFLNGGPGATVVPLFDLFRQSSLPLDATAGRIAVPLRFREDVQDGAGVKIGVQVVDLAATRSNCYSLELSFAVETVRARTVACTRLAMAGEPVVPRRLDSPHAMPQTGAHRW